MSLLDEAARIVIKDCLAVRPAEHLTVVCDETTEELDGELLVSDGRLHV